MKAILGRPWEVAVIMER